MLVRSKENGQLFESHSWKWNGPKYCSVCGVRLDPVQHYTRHQIFHPMNRSIAYMVKCPTCYPVEQVDAPGQPVPLDFRETEQLRIPVAVRESTPYPGRWERTLANGEEYRVETVVHKGIQRAIRKVLG